MRRLPPLNGLKAFEAAARLSSVSAAADELNVTHTAISQQIKSIEDYFGVQLFVKDGRGVAPTPDAITFMEELCASFDRIDLASRRLADKGLRRRITLNATPSFAMRWLLPIMGDFQLVHPSINIEVTTTPTDDISELAEPQDFIFRREPMRRRDHVCRKIVEDRLTPIMAPEQKNGARLESPEQLPEMTLLHMRSRPKAWAQWFKKQNIDHAGPMTGPSFDHFFLSIQAALTGYGVAIGPEALVEDDVRAGRLIAPFPDLALENPGFHILYRRELLDDEAGQAVIVWLEEKSGMTLH